MSSGQPDPMQYHSWPLHASTAGGVTSELRSTRPNLVLLLALDVSTGEGVHLKTEDGLFQTEDIFLKTKDSLLKTEDNRK